MDAERTSEQQIHASPWSPTTGTWARPRLHPRSGRLARCRRRDVPVLARAVEEVAMNVIRQAFEPGQRASFDIVVLRRPGRLVVAVEDRGLPFDFQSLEAREGQLPRALAALADAIHFANLGTAGNRVEIGSAWPSRPSTRIRRSLSRRSLRPPSP